MRKNNCDIVIGTDSYASNWQLNILEEIKTIQQETSNAIPLQDTIAMGNHQRRKSIATGQKNFGSFEKGKQPGVVLIDAIDNLNITNNSSTKRLI